MGKAIFMKQQPLSILIYSLASGGAERVVSILINKLYQKFDITLFLINDTIFYNLPSEIKIVYLEKSNPNESGIQKLLKLPFLAWKYKKLNKSSTSLSFMYRPNYINALAKLFGMKSVVITSERSFPSAQKNQGLQGKINLLLIKWLYKKATYTITNALASKYDLNINFKLKNVTTVYNPFDLNQISKQAKEAINIRMDGFCFISIGRLEPGKNHELMIKSMIPISAKLFIIGEGLLKEKLQTTIKKYHLEHKVFLLGRQKNPFRYLAKANCFLFTSNYEGFPNVLVEALACGLPVISTDCLSGPREILAPNSNIHKQIKDTIQLAEYGILTPIHNKKRLIEAMNIMITDHTLRKNYSKNAIKRASDFDADKIINQYETVLQRKTR